MKPVFSKKGFLKELIIDDVNIISPWGIETSDSSGFFTLNEKSCRQNIVSTKIKKNKNSISGFLKARLPHSYWRLNIDEKLSKGTIIRKNTLTCLDDSQFNDFVSRFRFKKKFVESVEIAGNKLFHRNSNIYYQYPAKEVVINLTSKKKIFVKISSSRTIPGLNPVMYARDSGEEWIVHARLFPSNPKIKQIKILRDWYNKAIPRWMSDILLSIEPLRDLLWYRGERKGYFPIGAYGLIEGKRGDILELKTVIECVQTTDICRSLK